MAEKPVKASVQVGEITLSVFMEAIPPNYWFAQVLEHDINTHASTAEQVYASIKRMIRLRYDSDLLLRREPFGNLPKAPRDFWVRHDNEAVQYSIRGDEEELCTKQTHRSFIANDEAWSGCRFRLPLSPQQ